MILKSRAMAGLVAVLAISLAGGAASAATIVNSIAGAIPKNLTANGGGSYLTTINDRDNSGDSDDNHLVPSFTRTFSLTVGLQSTDYDLTFTGIGGNLHNFNSPTFSYGIDNATSSDNNAIDLPGEGIRFEVSNVTNPNFSFDGFSALGIFFSQGADDAGAITDGTSDLWSFDGALGTNPGNGSDPAGTKVTGNSTDDSIYDWFGLNQHTHAQVDLSGFLPQTLEYEFRTATVAGQNRNRLNAVGVQFTVVPEPGSALLIGAMLSMLSTAGLLRYRWG